ncbi:MAG: efflux RND transporter periplasmic adaptor subunit [Acidobacteria bacterium]|nr:efflux RND transporter periplasmic adaptor subunit [Acidobacteriota bacterium]
MKKKTWIIAGAVLLVAAGGGAAFLRRGKDEVKWRTAKLDRGAITQRISATGAVAPVVQVAVGTQVSGVISALYADYNSIVKKGDLIAQIDPTVWETNLRDAEASLERSRTTMEDAKRQYDRAKRLASEKLLAEQDLDAKETAFRSSAANFENAKAALERAKANLAYCNITAPVDGVVISRLADVGQTVAASFSTPNLFQIAQDLSKMKVEISIDEADIDEVKVGQRAFFTVDSLPEKQFIATVSQVRLEPITTQNVVTYKVVIEVPNEPLPGAEGAGERPAEPAQGGRPGRPHAAPAAGAPPTPRPERPGGGFPGGPGGDFNPDKMWEMNKDRILERNPGMTKEEWLKRMKERMAQRQGGPGAGAPGGSPWGGRGAGAPAEAPKAPANASNSDRQAMARTPGGAARLGGPTFSGNLALRPGMTANVTIITNRKEGVLKVANAALRFNPNAFLKDETRKDAPKAGGLGQPLGMGMFPGGGQRPGGQGGGPSAKGMAMRREDRIWILENGKPKAITVKAGITDGQSTEITGEGLSEGMQVLVGVEASRPSTAPAAAPMGGMGGGGRR